MDQVICLKGKFCRFDTTNSTALACNQALDNATSMEVLDDVESKFEAAFTMHRAADESRGKGKYR